MAESNEDKPLTVGEARKLLPDVETAIKSYLDDDGKPLDELTAEELDELQDRVEARDELKALLSRADVKSYFTVDSGRATGGEVRRPTWGRTVAGSGEEVKAVVVEASESEDDKYLCGGPFKSMGHFAWAVRQAGPQPGLVRDGSEMGAWNQRIRKIDTAIKSMSSDVKAGVGMSEFADQEGASFVPIDRANEVWARAMSEENLLSLVDVTPVSGNGYEMSAWQDKSRATAGLLFGGARAYWGDEGSQMTNTKPATRKIQWKLNKLYVLMYATEELLEDTVALDSRLTKVAGACFAHKINSAIVRGTGAGQPLGLLNSACKITQAAVSAQGVNTVVGTNVVAMLARRSPGTGHIWLHNIDIEPQIKELNFRITNTAGVYLYQPAGSLRDGSTSLAALDGKRMIETEHCSALGTEGDLILWQPSSYGAIVKSTGIKQGVSMHLRFDFDEVAFKWTFRMDGRPFWDDVLTPTNGATRSPIVTLHSTRS